MLTTVMHSKDNSAYESEYSYLSNLKDEDEGEDFDLTYSDNEKGIF